jgi:hypothetical protein
MEKEARREVGRDERSGIICRKEIFDRKPYIVPELIPAECELRDVIYTLAVVELSLRSSLSKLGLLPLSYPAHVKLRGYPQSKASGSHLLASFKHGNAKCFP